MVWRWLDHSAKGMARGSARSSALGVIAACIFEYSCEGDRGDGFSMIHFDGESFVAFDSGMKFLSRRLFRRATQYFRFYIFTLVPSFLSPPSPPSRPTLPTPPHRYQTKPLTKTFVNPYQESHWRRITYSEGRVTFPNYLTSSEACASAPISREYILG
jgi:hypothetical protein